jgi:hypothetical protein
MISTSNFNSSALYTIDISSLLGSEYSVMFDDIVRMVLIQFTIQLMFYMSVPDKSFVTEEFVLLVLYIILGICLYWLVFKKMLKFV